MPLTLDFKPAPIVRLNKRVASDVDAATFEAVSQLAERFGCTKSELVRALLRAYLAQQQGATND